MTTSCATCDTAVVHDDGKPPHDIDVTATSDALRDRVSDGRMLFLRGDVPLEDMLALAESDLKYTIVSFLACVDCGRTRFWGLCIRGAPIYRIAEPAEVSNWRWSPVPPREQWAR
jgi:hypothetical protein